MFTTRMQAVLLSTWLLYVARAQVDDYSDSDFEALELPSDDNQQPISHSERAELQGYLSEKFFEKKNEHEPGTQKFKIYNIAAYIMNATIVLGDTIDRGLGNWFENEHNVHNGMRSTCAPDCGDYFDFEAIWEYGCWCNFGERAGRGGGIPVNKYDEACKWMTHCYRCAIWDGEEEGEPCTPWETQYTASVTHLMVGQSMQAVCQADDADDNCSWRSCTCEITMIAAMMELAFDPNATFDPSFDHGVFDYATECKSERGIEGERACCGQYPDRRSYNPMAGKECCQGKVLFNPTNLQCCADGSIISLGQFCP